MVAGRNTQQTVNNATGSIVPDYHTDLPGAMKVLLLLGKNDITLRGAGDAYLAAMRASNQDIKAHVRKKGCSPK